MDNASSMNGLINLDKPAGMSSARAVTIVKHLLPRGTKIGHAGTLDPFATGVLVLLVGKATRLCEQLMSAPKQYVATIKLGATTDTLDPTSPETTHAIDSMPALDAVRNTLTTFIGQIRQVPPAYSALKIAGTPAYKLARAGQTPPLQARIVNIYEIELLRYDWPELELRIDCGRGTYIRSLARDIGQSLAVGGGYLTHLRRTRVGDHRIAAAVTLNDLQRDIESRLIPAGDKPPINAD